MKDFVEAEGHAKINLTLDILGRRADGYHEVAMVMQSLALHDTVVLERAAQGISLSIDRADLPADEKNLAYRAAKLVIETCGLSSGVSIRLTKRIPIAAGLAGGSADAAAVLRGMNELFSLSLGDAELCALGARLGSDIPFTLLGGTMLAEGRGEKLRRLPDFPATPVVLAKPPVSVSTAWAYQAYDAQESPEHPDNAAVERALAAGSREDAATHLYNVLERVTISKYGIVSRYKEQMKEAGAIASMMSGSGPTVFGLARTQAEAEHIARSLRQREPEAEIILTDTVSKI